MAHNLPVGHHPHPLPGLQKVFILIVVITLIGLTLRTNTPAARYTSARTSKYAGWHWVNTMANWTEGGVRPAAAADREQTRMDGTTEKCVKLSGGWLESWRCAETCSVSLNRANLLHPRDFWKCSHVLQTLQRHVELPARDRRSCDKSGSSASPFAEASTWSIWSHLAKVQDRIRFTERLLCLTIKDKKIITL